MSDTIASIVTLHLWVNDSLMPKFNPLMPYKLRAINKSCTKCP